MKKEPTINEIKVARIVIKQYGLEETKELINEIVEKLREIKMRQIEECRKKPLDISNLI